MSIAKNMTVKKKIPLKGSLILLLLTAILTGCGQDAPKPADTPANVSDGASSSLPALPVGSGFGALLAGKSAADASWAGSLPEDSLQAEGASPGTTDLPNASAPDSTEDQETRTSLPDGSGAKAPLPGNPATDTSPGTDSSSPGTPGGERTQFLSPGGLSAAVPSVSGALRVDGTRLVDENGQAVQLKGISTHGLAWFPDFVNEACFRQLREEWNANVIRLAMYTAESGGYCTGGDQEALKGLINNGVEYATAQDMYVIIDWHILSDNNPNTYLTQSKDFFGKMAELYAGHNNVLYEICNEPNGGTDWKAIKSYAEEVISVIRAHDEDGIIIVGTPNWSQYVDQAAADPIAGYDNIMYALHFYAATHKNTLRNTMTAAIDAGLPIFVTEYGICDASGNGEIDEAQANQWVSAMNDCGISYVAWNLSNKNETSAILSSSCSKTFDFTDSDLSASGRWLYGMLTGQTAGNASSNREDSGKDSTASASGPKTDGSPASPSTDSSPPQQEQSPTAAISDADGGLSFSARLINSWESEGKTYYQYELTLQNNSGADCSSWAVDVPFNEAVTLSDSWNGDYTIFDSTLHITSKDYNGSITSGSSAGNIGFIVSGSSQMSILN